MGAKYDDAFYLACGTLAAKQMVISALQARARLGAGATPATFSEDKEFPLKGLFNTVFLADKIGLNSKHAVDRLEVVGGNNTRNEPFFLLAAYAFGKVCASAASPHLLTAYVATRCVHNAIVIGKKKTQPFRALSWVAGVGMGLFASISVVLKKAKK